MKREIKLWRIAHKAMSIHNHSTAHLLLQGNPNPRTVFKTRFCRQNLFSLAKSLGRDEMLQNGSLPQGGSQQCWEQEKLAFPSTYCFPSMWVATKGKDSTSKQESWVRGSSEPKDTKVTEDACDMEPEVLHHKRGHCDTWTWCPSSYTNMKTGINMA